MKKLLYKNVDGNINLERFEKMKKRFEKYEKLNFNEDEFMNEFSNSEGTKFTYEGKKYDIIGEIFPQDLNLFNYKIKSKEVRKERSYFLYMVENEEGRYYIWRNFEDENKNLSDWKVLKKHQIFTILNEDELEDLLMEIDVEAHIEDGIVNFDDIFQEDKFYWIFSKIVPIKENK